MLFWLQPDARRTTQARMRDWGVCRVCRACPDAVRSPIGPPARPRTVRRRVWNATTALNISHRHLPVTSSSPRQSVPVCTVQYCPMRSGPVRSCPLLYCSVLVRRRQLLRPARERTATQMGSLVGVGGGGGGGQKARRQRRG